MDPRRVEDLYEHVRHAASLFGQKCIYLERAGEADFVYAQMGDNLPYVG